MNIFLVLAFLFFIGSLVGWCLELVYRRFVSDANPDRKWINPGFLTGPYLPLYGFSLCALFMLAHINVWFIDNAAVKKIVLFIIMALVVTVIEYIAGIIFIERMNIKLWDYDNEWGNIKGIICPRYTFYWVMLSAIYYFAIHPHILNSLYWLSNHLAFSFVMGFFYGVFVIDLCYSVNMMARIKKFAKENNFIVRYEAFKESIRQKNEELKEKRRFIFQFRSDSITFTEHLKNYFDREQAKILEAKKNIQEKLKNK